jgi:DNA-binding Lrp family transcriptional regulator
LSAEGVSIEPEELRRLDHRARVVLSLFDRANQITTVQVAEALGLSPRMARVLLRDWVDDGWLEIADASNRNRAYGLSAMYRQYIGNASAKAGPRSNQSGGSASM